MNGSKKTPGEFVTSVTVSEVIISCGIQLVEWAHDLAFTDAPFGETWAMETADRMASLSELLNVVYKRLPRRNLEIVVDLPEGMLAQISINPNFVKETEKPTSKDVGDSSETGGIQNSIDDLPF